MLFFSANKIIFCFFYKIFIKFVVFGHFGHTSNISEKDLILQPDLTDNVSDLIDNVSVSYNTNNLNNHDNDNFWNIDRRYVSIADSKHCS